MPRLAIWPGVGLMASCLLVAVAAGPLTSCGKTPVAPTIEPAPVELRDVTVAPTSPVGGGDVLATVTLARPAPATGVSIRLAADDDTVSVPASLTIAGGAMSGTARIVSSRTASSRTVTLQAITDGSSRSVSMIVRPYPPLSGRWVGTLTSPYGKPIEAVIVLEQRDGGLSGSCDHNGKTDLMQNPETEAASIYQEIYGSCFGFPAEGSYVAIREELSWNWAWTYSGTLHRQ